MFKVMLFARKKPGLSRDEFIHIFETSHVPLTASLVANGTTPAASDYRRNYLVHDDPANIDAAGLNFDVVVEAIFESREQFAANRAAHTAVESRKIMYDSMAEFLDLESLQYVIVDECKGMNSEKLA